MRALPSSKGRVRSISAKFFFLCPHMYQFITHGGQIHLFAHAFIITTYFNICLLCGVVLAHLLKSQVADLKLSCLEHAGSFRDECFVPNDSYQFQKILCVVS